MRSTTLVPRVGTVLRRAGWLNSVEVSWVARIYQGFTDANPGWVESKRALRDIAALTRARGIPLVVAIYPLLFELDDYQGLSAHRTVAEFCETLRLPVIDLYPVFAGTSNRAYWINFLDSHPNREAHRLVADALAPTVARVMRTTAASDR